mgnify:CR=1 FL=1
MCKEAGDGMFADRLKQLRREKGLTQIQLATELNVASGTIAMWETGKREPNFAITNHQPINSHQKIP